MKLLKFTIRTLLTLFMIYKISLEAGPWTATALFFIFIGIEMQGFLIKRIYKRLAE